MERGRRRTNACVEACAEEGRGHAHADHARDEGPRGPQAVLARVRVRAGDCGVLMRGDSRLSGSHYHQELIARLVRDSTGTDSDSARSALASEGSSSATPAEHLKVQLLRVILRSSAVLTCGPYRLLRYAETSSTGKSAGRQRLAVHARLAGGRGDSIQVGSLPRVSLGHKAGLARAWLAARVSALAAATDAPPGIAGLGTALAPVDAATGRTLTPLAGSAQLHCRLSATAPEQGSRPGHRAGARGRGHRAHADAARGVCAAAQQAQSDSPWAPRRACIDGATLRTLVLLSEPGV